ncbi:MAG: SDR family NAD(P)-dependent oxidoreductase [Alphaproteobacteria bacterium]
MDTKFSSILITGASSGIGAAIALELAAPNVILHLTARNEERLNEVKAQCSTKGASVYTSNIDVTQQETLAEALKQWDAANPFDLIIANAGIAGNHINTPNPATRLRAINAVNVTGVLNTLEPILDAMIQRKKGHIGLVGSMASFLPLPPSPAYSASKSAILTWGDAIRPSLKKNNIHLSVICPGFVRSRITDANNYTMPFFMEADKAAQIIISGLSRKKARIAFPWPMYFALSFLSILPRPLQSWIVTRMPHKED